MCNIDIIPKFQFNIIPEESTRVGEVLPQLINCYAATTNPGEDDQPQILLRLPELSPEQEALFQKKIPTKMKMCDATTDPSEAK